MAVIDRAIEIARNAQNFPNNNSEKGQNNIDNYNIDTMNYEKAMRQAKDMMQPQYEQQREQVLGNLSRQQAQRGFYGQATGDAIQQSTLADMSNQYMGNLAQQAQQIRQQNFNRQMQQNQFDWNRQQANRQFEFQKKKFNWQKQNARRQREQEQESNFWGTVGGIVGGFLGGPAGKAIGNEVVSWF